MIHKLLEAIVTVLRAGFTGIIPTPAARITFGTVVNPNAGQLPRLAAYAGLLETSQVNVDVASSAVRPQELRERLTVSGGTPQGPYTLAKTPLEGSLLCQAVYQEGLVGERRQLFQEGKDFSVNYLNHTMTFTTSLAGAGVLLVQYNFPGIFTIREFRQEFFLDIFDNDPAPLERWSAISTAIVQTNHDLLLQTFNQINKTEHTANDYLSVHTVRHINLLSGTPALVTSPFQMKLKFEVRGEIRSVKQISGGFGLIERVHSPGKTGGPVDIGAVVE